MYQIPARGKEQSKSHDKNLQPPVPRSADERPRTVMSARTRGFAQICLAEFVVLLILIYETTLFVGKLLHPFVPRLALDKP